MLSKFSVKKPLVVVVLIIVIIGLGVVSFMNTGVDLLPQMDLPYVMVVTVYAGAAPDVVEKEITTPIEQSLAGISGIKSMTSSSSEHYSMVTLELKSSSDSAAVQAEIERALRITKLPSDSMRQEPIVLKIDPSLLPVMVMSIGKDGQSVKESSAYLDEVISKLKAADGVAGVSAGGLITNLAIFSLNSQKTAESLMNTLLNEFGIELALSESDKESLRVYLKDALASQDNDPEKILDAVLDRMESDGNDGLATVARLLRNENLPVRNIAINAITSILETSYILEDGEENKRIFGDVVDDYYEDGAVALAESYVSSFLGAVNSELLSQLIYAQDFDLPAGSIAEGVKSFVVKVGENLENRAEFLEMPVFTVDLASVLSDYLDRLQAILAIAAAVSPDGKTTLTEAQIKTLAQYLAYSVEEVDNYAVWTVDTLASDNALSPYYLSAENRGKWVSAIEANEAYATLTANWKTDLPLTWRTQLLTLVRDSKIYPANGVLLSPDEIWGQTYTDKYSAEIDAEYADAIAEHPSLKTFTVDADYAPFAESVVTSAHIAINPYSLTAEQRAEWVAFLSASPDFQTAVKDAAATESWQLRAYSAIKDKSLFPNASVWTQGMKNAYSDKFDLLRTTYRADAPQTASGYSDFLVNSIAQSADFNSADYLPQSFRSDWAAYLAASDFFKNCPVNAVAGDVDWRLFVLNYARTNKTAVLPADGSVIRNETRWTDDTSAAFETRATAAVTGFTPMESALKAAAAQIGEENLKNFMELFRGTDAAGAERMLVSMLESLEKYGGDGAVVITVDETTGEKTYTVDFAVLRNTLDSSSENLNVTLTMNDLGDALFTDDANNQITTLMTRDADGNFVVRNSVQLSVDKESDRSTAEVSAEVNAILKELSETDPDFTYSLLSDDGKSIDFMLSTVMSSLIFGALLAMLILLVFLRSVGATLAVSLSIVISVVFAFVMMYFSGITMNIVSMGGLAIGVGMLVDNSIVVLENINRLKAQGKTSYQAAIQGAKQVAGAIFASTLTTVVVFLPILFIDGMTKQIMKDLALTICFSLIASLLVALTFIPMSATTFLKKKIKAETKIGSKIKKGYAKALNFSLNNKWVVILAVVVLLGGSVFAAFSVGTEFFPDSYMGSVSVSCEFDKDYINQKNAGISPLSDEYYTMDDAYRQAAADMREVFAGFKDIKTAGISTESGISIAGLSLGGGSLGATLTLVDEKKREYDPAELCDYLQSELRKKNPSLYKATVSMASMASMFSSDNLNSYELHIYGDDFDQMISESEKIMAELGKIEGVVGVSNGVDGAAKEYKMVIDKRKANLYGLTVGQVYQQVSASLSSPESAHTLRIYTSDDATRKEDVEVYIYGNTYKSLSWYKATDGANAEEKVYFRNNGADAAADYYTENKTGGTVFIKTPDSVVRVAAGGEIPLMRDGGNFSYEKAVPTENADKTHTITYETVVLDVSDFAPCYSTRKEDVDLITLPIRSEDALGTGAATVTVPLYKLLDDSSFVRNADGGIMYRDAAQSVPASIRLVDGYASIRHYGRQKCLTVKVEYDSTVKEKKLLSDVNAAIAAYNAVKPDSVRVATDKEDTIMTEVFNTLYIVLAFAIVLIFLVMVAQFQSWKAPLIIMFTIPLAFTGSFALLAMTGMKLSVMALIGLVVLMGVVVNNGIVFVDYANRLIDDGVDKKTALFRTGIDRMRPIFMTALTTILAMVIMACDGSDYGKLLQPLAITSIGGLTYATLVTLFIIPVMYDVIYRKRTQSARVKAFKEQNLDEKDDNNVFDEFSPEMSEYVNSIITAAPFKLVRRSGKKPKDKIAKSKKGEAEKSAICEEKPQKTKRKSKEKEK